MLLLLFICLFIDLTKYTSRNTTAIIFKIVKTNKLCYGIQYIHSFIRTYMHNTTIIVPQAVIVNLP